MQVNNNRQEQRRNTTGTYSICWPDSAGQIKSAEAEVRDISKSGICIACSVEIPPGTTVYIEAKDGHARGYCAVRHCTGDDGNYRIGMEFDEETKARLESGKATTANFDYYEFLQISSKAESSTIQRIYRFMAARF